MKTTLEEKIMHTLNWYVKSTNSDFEARMAELDRAKARLDEAIQARKAAKTVADFQEAHEAEICARSTVNFYTAHAEYGRGARHAAELMAQWIQRDLEECREGEDDEAVAS